MQETHSDIQCESIWQNEWGGDIRFAHGATDARGVAILFCPNFTGALKETTMDEQGRILSITMEIDEKFDTLCNLYAPNQDTFSKCI